MKNILVPTDFSNNAFKALVYAGELARRGGAAIHIVHAYTLLENVPAGRSVLRESWNEHRKKEKASALLQVQQDFLDRFPELSTQVHLFTGPVDEVLLKYCGSAAIDLVVMGKHGAGGLSRLFMGSTTAQLIGRCRVPVLAIPGVYEMSAPAGLVLATSGFERSENLTRPVFEIASLLGLPVQVWVFAAENQVEAGILRAAVQMQDYVAWLKNRYPAAQITGYQAYGDNLETALEQYCEQNGAGMLCMLTYQRGFWDSLFNPSKTRQMAVHTRIPLLAVPA